MLNEDEKGTPLLQGDPLPPAAGSAWAPAPSESSPSRTTRSDIVAMIKAVEVPDEDEEKPRILALMCENDAIPALDLVGQHRCGATPSCG